MNSSAVVLFSLLDEELERHARKIRGRVFSEYKDMPWEHEQYQRLQPLLRHELNELLYSILGIFDNVGAVVPEDAQVLGYRIKVLPFQESATESNVPMNAAADEQDIRVDNDDYCEMWLRYLASKIASSSNNSAQ